MLIRCPRTDERKREREREREREKDKTIQLPSSRRDDRKHFHHRFIPPIPLFTLSSLTMLEFDYVTSFYAIVAITLVVWYLRPPRKGILPPGPVGLPFVGHLFHFGKDTFDKLTAYHEEFGKTFYLKMGIHDVIM